MNFSKKHKNKIILIAAIVSFFYVNKYFPDKYYDYKFNKELKDAAKIPVESWDKPYRNMEIKSHYKVAIIAGDGGGEYSYFEHFKYSAEKLGWEVTIYDQQVINHEEEILKFDPDFILYAIFTDPKMPRKLEIHRSKKYFINFHPLQITRNSLKLISKEDPYNALGILKEEMLISDALLIGAEEVNISRLALQRNNKKFNGIRLLPQVSATINQPADPKNIMWCNTGWDKLRSSKKYHNFINLLSNNTEFKSYGKYGRLQSYIDQSKYDGFIPTAEEMIKTIRKNGIYLLTHSDLHNQSTTPSLRIFEAVAANVIVISDKNPFAIKHFGDNFLYFDHNADTKTMYQQVKAHYDWILANPQKAKAMSERAHQIFLEKFTLEKDLIRIAKMHEAILKQEQEMHLSYPFLY